MPRGATGKVANREEGERALDYSFLHAALFQSPSVRAWLVVSPAPWWWTLLIFSAHKGASQIAAARASFSSPAGSLSTSRFAGYSSITVLALTKPVYRS